MISLKKRVTLTMFCSRKSFNATMYASLPKKILFAKFCVILAIVNKPRRMTGFVGFSTSTLSGETIAGEINLNEVQTGREARRT